MKLAHPNRRMFEGVLTIVGRPSDKPPGGSRKHLVILTEAAAREALHTLIGMAVAFKAGYDGHNARQKCGVITDATIVGEQLRVEGYLFDHDFPEVAAEIRVLDMGMSYEMCFAHVEDMQAEIYVVDRAVFSGAAILLRRKAAYLESSIRLKTALPSELHPNPGLLGHGEEDLLELVSDDTLDGLLHVQPRPDPCLPH